MIFFRLMPFFQELYHPFFSLQFERVADINSNATRPESASLFTMHAMVLSNVQMEVTKLPNSVVQLQVRHLSDQFLL